MPFRTIIYAQKSMLASFKTRGGAPERLMMLVRARIMIARQLIARVNSMKVQVSARN